MNIKKVALLDFLVGPNRNPYNPLGNSAANGILVGPGGPTGVYGRPPNYVSPNSFNGGGFGPGGIPPGGPGGLGGAGGLGGPGGLYNNFGGGPFNGGFPSNGPFPQNGPIAPNGPIGPNGPFPPIAFNSKSGAGISAQSDEPKGRDNHKSSNK